MLANFSYLTTQIEVFERICFLSLVSNVDIRENISSVG